jgi:dihydroorotate dehydrogenase
MNLLTVEPVPTPTISPGTTYFRAAWPTRVLSSSCVTRQSPVLLRRPELSNALLPYALARPFLFGLDPETAHELTLASLARCQGTPLRWPISNPSWRPRRTGRPALSQPRRPGRRPGQERALHRRPGAMGFGFVEVGTVTPKGQPGNPKPRMFRLPQANALINRLGFNNEGLDAFIANVQRSRFRRAGPPAGPEHRQERGHADRGRAPDDYLACLDGVYPHADYVTVNISSPNTKNLRALQSDEALDALLGASPQRRENWRRSTAGACRSS